jgi:hypothetical protein
MIKHGYLSYDFSSSRCIMGAAARTVQFRVVAGEGPYASWSIRTVAEYGHPRIFFRPERIPGRKARMTRRGGGSDHVGYNRCGYFERCAGRL